MARHGADSSAGQMGPEPPGFGLFFCGRRARRREILSRAGGLLRSSFLPPAFAPFGRYGEASPSSRPRAFRRDETDVPR